MPSLLVCGAINWDSCFFVERLPLPGEEVKIKEISRVSGGTGANVAVAAARILGSGEVILAGALGQDELARLQLDILEREGIVTQQIKLLPGKESGQAYILIEESGQNVIASYLGANAMLSWEHLKDAAGLAETYQGILLTDPPLDVATALLSLAEQKQIPVFWDPGILIEAERERLRECLGQADTLFLNETEAVALLDTSEPELILHQLRSIGLQKAMLKLGSQGAVLLEPKVGRASQIPALPVEKLGLKAVSTVGCGDAFVGAFAAYQVLGAEPEEALLMASAAAGLCATKPETRGSPDRQTLEEMAESARESDFFAPRSL